ADALAERLRAHYALLTSVAAFSPEQPGRRRVYDRQDAFYLPLDGFDGIDRPGPNLLIYVRSELAGAIPAAASATAR
ncbi:MAG: hypothetical protein NTY02_20090, partial [Acidobacteria bacterium]|nr:hypothetical protein [Acidobacteriota bacterium]